MKPDRIAIQTLIDEKSKMLLSYIRDKHKLSWDEAMIKMTGSMTYSCLIDESTEYIYESDEFIKYKYDLEEAGNMTEWAKRQLTYIKTLI